MLLERIALETTDSVVYGWSFFCIRRRGRGGERDKRKFQTRFEGKAMKPPKTFLSIIKSRLRYNTPPLWPRLKKTLHDNISEYSLVPSRFRNNFA